MPGARRGRARASRGTAAARRLSAAGPLAGLLVPPLLAAVIAGLTLHQRRWLGEVGWHPVRRTEAGWPSVLALGELGRIETVAFAVGGALGLIFALALWTALPGRVARAGALVLALLAAVLTAEALPPDPTWAVAPERTWHGRVHDEVYPLVPATGLVAPALLALGLWRRPGWHGQARLAAGATAALVASLPVQAADPVGQLGEYLFFGPLILWLELLAAGLWRRRRVSPPGSGP